MPKFGHVLNLHECTDAEVQQAAGIIAAHTNLLQTVGNTIFFQTNSKVVTDTILDEIQARGLGFTAFHNQIASGSWFRSHKVDVVADGKIAGILRVTSRTEWRAESPTTSPAGLHTNDGPNT